MLSLSTYELRIVSSSEKSMKEKETYHHGDLQQRIIEEALFWIEQENIVSLSLRGIARNLGVSHNAPYRHFPDKESLLNAIAIKGFGQLHQALQQAATNYLDNDRKRLEAIGVAYIQYALQNQAYYRVMFCDRRKNVRLCLNYQQVASEAFNVLLNVIKAGQTNKVFIPEEAEQLASVCWSLVHGVSMLAIDGQLEISNPNSILELAEIATKVIAQGLTND
jgi:AcrR family transcriptional regulator